MFATSQSVSGLSSPNLEMLWFVWLGSLGECTYSGQRIARHVKLIELTCNVKLAGCWKYLFCLSIIASVNCETDVFHAPTPCKVDRMYNGEASDSIQVKLNFQSEVWKRITYFEK